MFSVPTLNRKTLNPRLVSKVEGGSLVEQTGVGPDYSKTSLLSKENMKETLWCVECFQQPWSAFGNHQGVAGSLAQGRSSLMCGHPLQATISVFFLREDGEAAAGSQEAFSICMCDHQK